MREDEINSVKKLIDYAVESYGEKDFILFKRNKEVESRSFIDAKNDSNAISRMLEHMGIKDVNFAIGGNTSYEWIVAYLGVINSGNIIVPYDKKEAAADLSKILIHADVEGIIFDKSQKKNIEYLRKENKNIKYFISLDSLEDEGDVISLQKAFNTFKGEYSNEIDNEKVCTIMYSSGTTGERKGIMLTPKAMTRNVMNNMEYHETHAKRILTVLPIHHAYCFTCDILSSFRMGHTVCVGTSIGSIFADFKLYHPIRINIVPAIEKFIYDMIKKHSDLHPEIPFKDLAREMLGGELTQIICGGAFIETKLIEQLIEVGVETYVGYGMTECSPLIATNYIDNNKIGSSGRALRNTEIKIVDNEIVVKSESVMKGYYKNEEATKEVLKDGWLRTEDYGYIDEEGYLFITGRKKNLIILENGENISPEEIENKIYEEPIVKEVLVFGKDNKLYAEIFPDLDFVSINNITDIDKEIQLAIFRINQKFPVYKKIEEFIIREKEFEKTSSNKIKRVQR